MQGLGIKTTIGSAVVSLSLLGAVLPLWAQTQTQSDYLPCAPQATVPPGYPASYETIIRAAENEGKLMIYAATDRVAAEPLIVDFRRMYPRIEVTYEELNTTEAYYRFVAESKLGSTTADILWSSAMDQQAALVSDGYAMHYESQEKAGLPNWAVWKDEAFATTYEPVVIAYNKQLLAASEVPQSHADLAKLIASDPARFSGKVTSYNIEKSGVGFLLATRDSAISQDFWAIAQAFGKARADLDITTAGMVKKLAAGDSIIGYNLLGGYTAAHTRTNPSIGYVYPRDYTLILSRVMLANRQAENPNAAKLWIDYVLSKRGQSVIANESRLYAIREDVEGDTTARQMKQTLGASERPIALGPELIGYMNNANYRDFILQWKKALSGS